MDSKLKRVGFNSFLLLVFLLVSCSSQRFDSLDENSQQESSSLSFEDSASGTHPRRIFSDEEKQKIVEKFFKKYIDLKNVLSEDLETQIQDFFAVDYQTIKSRYSNDLNQQYTMVMLWEYLYKLMVSEYHLVRIVGEKRVHRIQSLILGSPFYYGLGQIGNAFLDKPREDPKFEPELFIHILSDISVSYKNLEDLDRRALKALRTSETASHLDDSDLYEDSIITSLLEFSKESSLGQGEEAAVIKDIEGLRQAITEFLILIYKQKNMFFESLPIAMLIFEEVKMGGKKTTLSEKLIADTHIARNLQQVRGWSEVETWEFITRENWSIIQNIARRRLDSLYDQGYHAVVKSGGLFEGIPFLEEASQGISFFIKYDLLRYQVQERLHKVGAQNLIHLESQLIKNNSGLVGFVKKDGAKVIVQIGAIFACRSTAAAFNLSRGVVAGAMFPLFASLALKGVGDIESEEDELRVGASYGLNSQFAFYQLQDKSRARKVIDAATAAVFTGIWCMPAKPPAELAALAAATEKPSLPLRMSRRVAHPIKYPKNFEFTATNSLKGAWVWTSLAVTASLTVYLQAQSWIYSRDPWRGFIDLNFWEWIIKNPDQLQSLILMGGTEFIYMFRGLTAKDYIRGIQRASIEVFLYSSLVQMGRYLYYDGNLDNYDFGRNFFEATYISFFSTWKATRIFVPLGMHANVKLARMGYGSFMRKSVAFGILTGSNYIGNGIYALAVDDAYNGRFYEMIDDLTNENFEYEQFIRKYSLPKDLYQAIDGEAMGGDHQNHTEHIEGDVHDHSVDPLPSSPPDN